MGKKIVLLKYSTKEVRNMFSFKKLLLQYFSTNSFTDIDSFVNTTVIPVQY